jgi:hypothetical protein
MIDNPCDNCPLRLFNNKCHNLQGVGNPFMGKLIILPNVDYDAYKHKDMSFSKQVEVLMQNISFTGELADTYIVPLIRCNESLGCDINDDIIRNCQRYLAEDVKTYDFKHIMLCGSSVERFLHGSIYRLIDSIVVSGNNRRYYSNYSPLIKYVDESKFKTFVEKVDDFLYSATNNDYSKYDIVNL